MQEKKRFTTTNGNQINFTRVGKDKGMLGPLRLATMYCRTSHPKSMRWDDVEDSEGAVGSTIHVRKSF